jgi:hypothetical protein
MSASGSNSVEMATTVDSEDSICRNFWRPRLESNQRHQV